MSGNTGTSSHSGGGDQAQLESKFQLQVSDTTAALCEVADIAKSDTPQCIVCGCAFLPSSKHHPHQKYCDATCRNTGKARNYRARHAEKYNAAKRRNYNPEKERLRNEVRAARRAVRRAAWGALQKAIAAANRQAKINRLAQLFKEGINGRSPGMDRNAGSAVARTHRPTTLGLQDRSGDGQNP